MLSDDDDILKFSKSFEGETNEKFKKTAYIPNNYANLKCFYISIFLRKYIFDSFRNTILILSRNVKHKSCADFYMHFQKVIVKI